MRWRQGLPLLRGVRSARKAAGSDLRATVLAADVVPQRLSRHPEQARGARLVSTGQRQDVLDVRIRDLAQRPWFGVGGERRGSGRSSDAQMLGVDDGTGQRGGAPDGVTQL